LSGRSARRHDSPLSLATYRLGTLFWAILIALGAIQAIVGIWLVRRARRPDLSSAWDSVTGLGGGTGPS
jgi:hypothetical protein